jgi:WD40 repeat protein
MIQYDIGYIRGGDCTVGFDPKGDLLAALTQKDQLLVVNLTADRELLNIKEDQPPRFGQACFSPDSRNLAVTFSDGTLKVWAPGTDEAPKLLKGHKAPVQALKFNASGTVLATGSEDGEIRLWDWKKAECVRILTGHAKSIKSLTFSPDGSQLVSAGDDKTVHAWNVSTGKVKWSHHVPAGIISCSRFSPDGGSLAIGRTNVVLTKDEVALKWSGEVRILNAADGKEQFSFQPSDDGVALLLFTPDGKRIVTSGSGYGEVQVWDAGSGELLLSPQLERLLAGLGPNVRPLALCFDPRSQKLAYASRSDITVWDGGP